MKVCCDLCGGTLQVLSCGEDAVCKNCGLTYPMERLREMLAGIRSPGGAINSDPAGNISSGPKVTTQRLPAPFTPVQFVMENTGGGVGDLSGKVLQGGIGLGDSVYIDGDYAHPYRVYLINDDPYMYYAKEGMPAELFLAKCPRRILKNAKRITGIVNPTPSAYNFPGTVREYFMNLLLREYPQHVIREDVTCEGLKIPASFMLYHQGKPVLALFLIDSRDSNARYQMEKAPDVLTPEGIACVHFFQDYRNDTPYVRMRIGNALNAAAQ